MIAGSSPTESSGAAPTPSGTTGAGAPQVRMIPLSSAQERFWLLQRISPEFAVSNIAVGLRLRGRLDVDAMRASLQELVDRHEALRTVFPSRGGEPVQLVLPRRAVELPLVDVGPGEERWVRHARQVINQPFDLGRGPLLRAELLRLGPEEHLLVLAVHHVVADRWSLGVLMRDLTGGYLARTGGYLARTGGPGATGVRPAAPSVGVADYVAWEQERCAGPDGERLTAYWRKQLEALPGDLQLPFERTRPAARSYRGAEVPFDLPAALSRAVRELCRNEGVTPYMAFLAAFQALLGRYTGSDDIVVNTSRATRPAGTEDLVGCLINTLLMRTSLAGDPTYRRLLGQVRQVALEAFEHQDLPFERVWAAVASPERQGNPPLQAGLVVQNAPLPALELDGLEVEPVALPYEWAHMDLNLELWEDGDGFSGRLEYDRDLCDATVAQRVVTHWQTLLAAAVANPDAPLARLSPLPEAERRRLLEDWNDTAVELPAVTTLSGLFEQRVARGPDTVALVHDGGEVSYGELNSRANRLARRLVGLGVGPETGVALLMHRSVDLVVAILAVVKAGGFYVPLDSRYPAAHRRLILQETAARVLVTDRGSAEEAAELVQDGTVPTLFADDEHDLLALDPSDLGLAHDPDALAYVMYTSGSTGRPKGVAATHRGVVALATDRRFTGGGYERVLLHAPYSFDASTAELWVPLLGGGQVVVAPDGVLGAREMDRLLAEHTVTGVFVTAGLFALIAEENPACFRGVREILTGGDVVSPVAVARVREVCPDTRVVVGYGPTEVTMLATTHAVEGGEARHGALPIGRPLDNTRVHVLDAALQPVPVGVVGELYVAGVGTARGYLDRPGPTAERFLPDPYGPPGSRMYRTGDLVRWLEDGALAFVGRVDTQVKIRGFRIEPAGIEAVLAGHPAVAQAVVVVREDRPGDKRLVGYVVPAPGAVFDAAQLRGHVAAALPEYMVPGVLVRLDELPLSPNDKVDRAALPAPEPVGADRPAPTDPPATELAVRLAEAWTQVLDVAAVGMDDDFFELGGHSLSASRLAARIKDAVGVDVPLRVLFEARTLAAQEDAVQELLTGAPAGPASPAPRRVERGERAPLSFAQQRMWFADQLEPGSAVYHVPLPVRLAGPLDADALRAALGALVARHEILRTVYRLDGDQPVQQVLPAADVALPLIDLTSAGSDAERDQALRDRVAAAATRPFDLAAEPPVRWELVRLGQEDHALLAVLHHIAVDGWSTGVLLRELAELYPAVGRPGALPEPPLQYADYALWQHELADSGALDEQLRYWQDRLSGVTELDLPTDRPRTAGASFRGGQVDLVIGAELAARVRALAASGRTTLFTAASAAFQVMLGKLSGRTDVAVGTPVAGRSRSELEGLVGCFVNTVVLRADLAADPRFRDVLAAAGADALAAFAHQDVPFERVADLVAVDRHSTRTPVFQAMFALQNAPMPELAMGAVRIAPLAAGTSTSLTDLVCTVVEQGDELAVTFEYDADLFDASTVDGFARCYRHVLDQVSADPEIRLSGVDLLDAQERHRVLVELNDTDRPVPELPVHRLIAELAHRSPQSEAVDGGSTVLSRAQLDDRAGALARSLSAAGVGRGSVVALVSAPTADLVVAILAVLKAGAAFLPLDPAYPAQRMRRILEHSRARLVLADAGSAPALADAVPDPGMIRPIDVTDTRADRVEEPDVDGDDLACVFYTSGTTGVPKGVAVTHGALANYTRTMVDAMRLTADDRFLQLASIGFDVLLEEVFPALAAGATVVMPGEPLLARGADLAEHVEARRVTCLELTTAYWHAWVEELEVSGRRPPQCLRLIAMGGERVLPDRLATWRGFGVPLLHVYGLTEVTCTSTVHLVEGPAADDDVPSAGLPIGRPVDNTRIYLLDRDLRPVPPGVPGELCIGGLGLARGYLHDPARTADRFAPDPFSAVPGARMYRTGDLARLRPDGTIDFIGRADNQVKLRGFRIELGEVEAAMAAHPEVTAAVAVLYGDRPADRRLAGYVTLARTSSTEPVGTAELRSFLRDRLPGYMVPSVVVVLDALPLTANGKIDKAALPHPGGGGDATGPGRAPQTPVEERLAELCAELLGTGPVGMDDDFFELGGHSLLATRFITRVRAEFAVDVPLRAFFEAPTLGELAVNVVALQAAAFDLDELTALMAELGVPEPGADQP
ncbi:amino acid adenylation domain-containing protein [Kitasatospora sp. NPDC085464]|uniref:amino acid adenylation domain-containing protein n=1 Tax=Kitasatospora sp. NPDC085464 TaxID=3364063 RepID=UPI0037C776AB